MVQILDNDASFGSFISESVLRNVSLNKGIDFRIDNRNNEVGQCRIAITSK